MADTADPVVSIVFILLKSILILYCGWQLWTIYNEGHKVVSFKGIFLSITILWSLLRLIFWSIAANSAAAANSAGGVLILLLPFSLQFALFGLLAIFYQKLTLGFEAWRARPMMARGYRVGVLVGTLVLVVVEVVEAVWSESGDQSYSDAYFTITALIYLFLSVTFSLQTYRLAVMPPQESRRLGIFSPPALATTTGILVIIFLTRVVFDLLAAAHKISFVSVSLTSHRPQDVAKLLAFYIFWEDLPIWMLIFVLAAARVGSGPRSRYVCGGEAGWLQYREDLDTEEWGGSGSNEFGPLAALNRGVDGSMEGTESGDEAGRAGDRYAAYGAYEGALDGSYDPFAASGSPRDSLLADSATQPRVIRGGGGRRPQASAMRLTAGTPGLESDVEGGDLDEDADHVGDLRGIRPGPASAGDGLHSGAGSHHGSAGFSPGAVPTGLFGVSEGAPSASHGFAISLPPSRSVASSHHSHHSRQ